MHRLRGQGGGLSAEGTALPQRDRRVRRVIVIEGAVNLLVVFLKLGVGLATQSLAVIADALHSLTDVANNAVAWLVLRQASQPPDRGHPYGHRKFETIAVFALASLLTVLAIELLRESLAGTRTLARQEGWGLGVMGFVLVLNVALASWESRWAKRLGSPILRADASHTFADVLTTLVVIAGWQASARGVPWVDQLCASGVGLLILYLAFGLFRRALPVLVDAAALDPDAVARIVRAVPGVRGVGEVRSRSDGTRTSVDLVIRVDPQLTTAASHAIADRVEAELERRCGADDVSVHVEPEAPRA